VSGPHRARHIAESNLTRVQLLIFRPEGELTDLVDEFSEGRIQFAFVKVKDPNSSLPKNVLIAWVSWAPRERE
jgi:hypothetical protein